MDLGCKLIMGSGLQEEPPSLPPFSDWGACTEIFFYIFIFCLRGTGWGGGGTWRDGGMICVHPVPPLMLSQCFFSLSLELVLRHQPGALAGCPMPGASGRRQAAPPVSATRGHQHATRHPPPASPQTLVAQPSGASVFGARGARRDCALPSAPTPEKPPPRHQQIHAATSH